MINIRLEDAEIRKLSEITQISEFDLQKLYTEGLLNDSAVINRLMKYTSNFSNAWENIGLDRSSLV